MSAKNTSKWGSDKARCYADGGEVGVGEKIARYLSEGRDQGQRAFYNATRAGLLNSETAPENANTYGGLGSSLATKKFLQGRDALDISDAVPRKGEK